jgi:hypothetical protein
MDMDSVECLSLPDSSMDVDDVDGGGSVHHHHHHHHALPPHLPAGVAVGVGPGGRAFPKANVAGVGGGGAAGAPAAGGAVAGGGGPGGGPPATSVHELLECPVCTNSMFPPIHQVGLRPSLSPRAFDLGGRSVL